VALLEGTAEAQAMTTESTVPVGIREWFERHGIEDRENRRDRSDRDREHGDRGESAGFPEATEGDARVVKYRSDQSDHPGTRY
jgi:hypothetical protein